MRRYYEAARNPARCDRWRAISPIGRRSMCAGRRDFWTRLASASTFRTVRRRVRPMICIYVSPESGRAVSRAAGAPYRSGFSAAAIPPRSQNAAPRCGGNRSGAAADRHFLLERVSAPHGRDNAGRAPPPCELADPRIGIDFRLSITRGVPWANCRSKTTSGREQLGKALSRALSGLCAVDHHAARAARCARRIEAGSPPHALGDAGAGPQSQAALQEMRARRRRRHRQISSAWRPVRSTTRWCDWRRISPCAIRWSTGRAISAMSTAIIPPPCVTPKAADRSCAGAARRPRRERRRFPPDL